MKTDTRASSATPWYQVGMVWMVIGLPLSVVVASMITVAIAYQNAPTIIQTSDVEQGSDKAG